MKCPACDRELTQMNVADIVVDACQGGCGGIWYDNFELKKFDEPHEAAGQALLGIERDPGVKVDLEARRKCPKCDDITMMRHFFSVKRAVSIDECGSCAGVWLDPGELRNIREAFPSEDARHAAADAYFTDLFGDKLDAMHKESEEGAARAKKFARVFRFICPTYYIPGKQEWGAF